MKKIRIGNDIRFRWKITRDGKAESFDGKEVDVALRDQMGRRWPVKWSAGGDGCVSGVFYGHMQQAAGTYSLTLTENRGGKGMATVDCTAAWQLVERQDNACEGGDEGALGVSVELMAGEIAIPGGVAEQEPAGKEGKRVKRYVIGRAIRPGSLDDPGHENWYCYGDGESGLVTLPVYFGNKGGMVKRLVIDGEEIESVPQHLFQEDNPTTRNLCVISSYGPVAAYAVRRYEWDAEWNLELWLEGKAAPATLRSESTHHSFVRGKRVWRGNYLRKGIVLDGVWRRLDGRTQIALAKKMRLTLGGRFVAWRKARGWLRRQGDKLTNRDGDTVLKYWWKRLPWGVTGKVRMPGLYRIRERQYFFGRLGEEVRVEMFVRLSMEMRKGGMKSGLILKTARDDRAYLHIVKK